MNFKYITIFFALTLLVFSCVKEDVNQVSNADESEVAALIAQAEAEWEASIETYNGELSTRSYGNPIYVKAGSKNAIQAAIDAAGINGKVILKSGMHYESSRLNINKCMTLEGENGAVLVSDNAIIEDFETPMDAAIYVKGGVKTTIRNFEIRPKESKGGTAIIIQDNDFAKVENMTIKHHQNGVLIEESNNTKILNNTVIGPDDWFEDPAFPAGLFLLNGSRSTFKGNTVSNVIFGMFLSGKRGLAQDNVLTGTYMGAILCNSTPFTLPDGKVSGSKVPCTRWIVKENESDYSGWGFLTIDGANRNYVYNNQSSNSEYYDFEFAGESYRFGFLTPTSSQNLFSAGKYQNVSVKDCGKNNQTFGGSEVDTNEDPCF